MEIRASGQKGRVTGLIAVLLLGVMGIFAAAAGGAQAGREADQRV